MFLRNQFFFFRFYFKIMDRMNCILFTWNPKVEYFEMSQALSTKMISHVLIVFQFMWMCAATCVFLAIQIKEESMQIESGNRQSSKGPAYRSDIFPNLDILLRTGWGYWFDLV